MNSNQILNTFCAFCGESLSHADLLEADGVLARLDDEDLEWINDHLGDPISTSENHIHRGPFGDPILNACPKCVAKAFTFWG